MRNKQAKPKSEPTKPRKDNLPSTPAASEKWFATLMRHASDVIQLVTPEGNILYTSESVITVLDYTPEEIQGKAVEYYIHPDDWVLFGTQWSELLKHDQAELTLEYRVKHKDGLWIWVETKLSNHTNTPKIHAVLSNFRNITERKKAEEQLKERERQFRFLAESMPQKTFTALADGTVDYVNPQWDEYSGITIENLLVAGWGSIVHPDELAESLRLWNLSVESHKPFSVEHRMRRHDGEYRWHLTRATAMLDEHGKVTKWFGSSTDIHHTKLAHEREHILTIQALSLTKEREKLLELNASKDEFISLASHQLRTPATVVKQYLNLILDGHAGELNPVLEDMIIRAITSNERQIDIVDDLLRVARLDAGKVTLVKTRTNITPLVQEVVNEHLSILEDRHQQITIHIEQPGVNAVVDTARLKMVFENLLDNASKYSAEGKTISLMVDQNKDWVSIRVTDQGVGIVKKDISKLFQKFSRISNPLSVAVGGTGLGLYWAKRIIDLHGGSIDIKSSRGKGSTFTVNLPRTNSS